MRKYYLWMRKLKLGDVKLPRVTSRGQSCDSNTDQDSTICVLNYFFNGSSVEFYPAIFYDTLKKKMFHGQISWEILSVYCTAGLLCAFIVNLKTRENSKWIGWPFQTIFLSCLSSSCTKWIINGNLLPGCGLDMVGICS